MNSQPLIRVAIADDHTVMRKGIAGLINKFENIRVVMEAGDGQALLEQLKSAKALPDICILDYSMPEMNGHETLLEIKKRFPAVKVMALSMFDNEYNILQMLSGGAGGYLLKDCQPEVLNAALRSIYTTGVYYSDGVPKEKFETSKEKISSQLSEKEKQYLHLCCQGLLDKEIAEQMNISPRSVEPYRQSLCKKFKVKNKTDLIIFAIETGIVIRKNPGDK